MYHGMKNISDHILDIVQNSVRAKATLIEIMVDENKNKDLYTLEIKDNGCGMKREVAEKSADPFFTTRKTRKVGLGLSLLKQKAEDTGGKFEIYSEENSGTRVQAIFRLSHIDLPPNGDMGEMFYLVMAANEHVNVSFLYKTDKVTFEISTTEIKKQLARVSLKNREIRNAIIELINNNLK